MVGLCQPYVYIMFPATTAAQNVAPRFLTVYQGIRYKPWAETSCWTPETRRRTTFKPTVCHGRLYVSSRPATFWWDLSRFVTLQSKFATSIKFCQGPLRLAVTAG